MDYQEKKNLITLYKELYSDDIAKLENVFYGIFPNGKIEIWVGSGVGSPLFRINMLLIGDQKDQSFSITENDPISVKFLGFLPEIPNPTKQTKFVLEKLNGRLSCKPEKGSYLAMSSVKLPFRKSTGDIANQSKKLVRFFKKVAQTVIDNKDNLYKDDILPKYLEINL